MEQAAKDYDRICAPCFESKRFWFGVVIGVVLALVGAYVF